MKRILPIFLILLSVPLLVSCIGKTYKVTIDNNNGTELIIVKVKENKTIKKLEEPKKEGYIFTNWEYNNEKFDINTKITSDIYLKAKYGVSTYKSNKILNAYNNHLKSLNFEVEGRGTINASIVKQTMLYKKSRKNDDVYLYNATYGSAVIITIKPYVEIVGSINKVTIEKGFTKKDLTKDKLITKTDHTYSEYSDLYGGDINSFNYIINEETIIDIIEFEDNKFRIDLDLEKSTVNYKTYISQMNPEENEKDSIIFNKVTIDVSLDDSGNFKSIEYNEEYSINVKAPIIGWSTQTITSNIKENYKYN